jgi:hypothetical protein
MNRERSKFAVIRRLAFAVVPLLVIAFGAAAVFGNSTAEAAPSLGVGCSASSVNGVTTASVRFTIRNGVAGQTLAHPGIGGGSTAITGVSPQVVGPIAITPGTYLVTLLDTDGTTVLRTAEVTVETNGGGVRCRVRTPAP